MIICICRGKSDRDIARAIENGAESVADLQRCGIGTECGSCHNFLRMMLAEAAAKSAEPACPCSAGEPTAVAATA